MSIGIQREPGGEVAQHTGDGFYINPVLQGNGSKGVPAAVGGEGNRYLYI